MELGRQRGPQGARVSLHAGERSLELVGDDVDEVGFHAVEHGEARAHRVEGARQLGELVLAPDRKLDPEPSRGDRRRSRAEPIERPEDPPDDDERGEERDGRGQEQRAEPERRGPLRVRLDLGRLLDQVATRELIGRGDGHAHAVRVVLRPGNPRGSGAFAGRAMTTARAVWFRRVGHADRSICVPSRTIAVSAAAPRLGRLRRGAAGGSGSPTGVLKTGPYGSVRSHRPGRPSRPHGRAERAVAAGGLSSSLSSVTGTGAPICSRRGFNRA